MQKMRKAATNRSGGQSFAPIAENLALSEENLLPTHRLVLEGLETAIRVHKRACTVAESCEHLSDADKDRLRANYAKPLSQLVGVIFGLLAARNLVETYRSGTGKCYYGSRRILYEAGVPDNPSRRRRALALLELAVAFHSRAVRAEEVWAFACEHSPTTALTKKELVHDLLSLAQTGELNRVACETRGFRGNTFYLPANLREEDFRPDNVSNWQERIYSAFVAVWTRHVAAADQSTQKPAPATTKEVRLEFYAQWPDACATVDSQRIINTLLYLCSYGEPRLRKLTYPGRCSTMWVPFGIEDSSILNRADVYASDAERIEVAVDRATRDLDRPTNARDINKEIAKDPALELESRTRLSVLLADTSKPMSTGKPGQKAMRKVKRVGRVRGASYYAPRHDGSEAAETTVNLLKIQAAFQNTNYIQQLEGIERASISLLRWARARLLRAEIQHLLTEFETIDPAALTRFAVTEHRHLEIYVGQALQTARRVEAEYYVASSAEYDLTELDLSEPTLGRVGLSAKQALEIVQPFYPAARRRTDPNRIVILLEGRILRFPNPQFKSRFSPSPSIAAEYLYDRAHLLMRAAGWWGTSYSRLQALKARAELGRLRNPAFVLPLLRHDDSRVRHRAAACLAFLSGTQVKQAIDEASEIDDAFAVRRVSQWGKLIVSDSIEDLILALKAQPHVNPLTGHQPPTS